MNKYTFLDAPDKPKIFGCLFFSVLAFFSMPFLLVLLGYVLGDIEAVNVWLDLIYHGANCAIVLMICWSFLSDCVLMFTFNKKMVTTILMAALLILGYGHMLMSNAFARQDAVLAFAAEGAMPITEIDVKYLGSALSQHYPIAAIIILVLLCPVTITCMFYMCAFVPAYTVKPWLGYLAVTVMTAFPTACMIFSQWDVKTEIVLYLVRLPVHYVACWVYSKTKTPFAPMVLLALVNLVGCLLYIFIY